MQEDEKKAQVKAQKHKDPTSQSYSHEWLDKNGFEKPVEKDIENFLLSFFSPKAKKTQAESYHW